MDERNEITTIQTDDYIGNALADGFSLDDMEWIKEHSNLTPADFFSFAHQELEAGKTLQRFKSENEIPLAYDIDKSGKLIAVTNQIVASDEAEPEVLHALQMAKQNIPAKTIANFYEVLRYDPKFENIRFNVFSNRPEHLTKDFETGRIKWLPWDDFADSNSIAYIEQTYGLCADQKFFHAFNKLCSERKCNPVTDMLRNLPKWDGEERSKYFLEKFMKADPNRYTRFASQIIFDAAVSRAFDPGCKFDLCVVLIGEESGEGKSTIVQWLAIDNEYAGELTEISGDNEKNIEAIIGRWIIEVGEFLLPENKKVIDATKAFITRTQDIYRTKFNRHMDLLRRRCIFIATTNHREFLSDPTGNRRWLPVVTHSDGTFLYDHKQEVMEYILNCYAEAVYRYDNGLCVLNIPNDLRDTVKKKQGQALMEDSRIGIIAEYCKNIDCDAAPPYICGREIWRDALNYPVEKYGRKEAREIREILRSIPFLQEEADLRQTLHDGKQRCFRIIPEKIPVED